MGHVVAEPPTLDLQPTDVIASIGEALRQRAVEPPCLTLEEAWERKKEQQRQRNGKQAAVSRPKQLPPVILRVALRRDGAMKALRDLLAFSSTCRSFRSASRTIVESARHTLLRTLAHDGDLASLRVLLDHGTCDVNAADEVGYTALMVACMNGRPGFDRCARWLLFKGADDSVRSLSGQTARELGGYPSKASHDYLVEGLFVECSTRAGVLGSCIRDAMRAGEVAIVERLVGHPECDVNWRDDIGLSLLHLACRTYYSSTVVESTTKAPTYVRLLLQRKGVQVDYADPRYGDTALMAAACNGLVTCVHLLLEAGADRTILNRDGRTALEATLHGNNMSADRAAVVQALRGDANALSPLIDTISLT